MKTTTLKLVKPPKPGEIDELDELVKLFEKQKERVEIEFAIEKKIKKLMPLMNQEMRLAKDILNTIAQLKMDQGLQQRHLGTVDLDTSKVKEVAGAYGKPDVGSILSNPKSRRKISGVLSKLALVQREREAIGEAEADPEPTDE